MSCGVRKKRTYLCPQHRKTLKLASSVRAWEHERNVQIMLMFALGFGSLMHVQIFEFSWEAFLTPLLIVTKMALVGFILRACVLTDSSVELLQTNSRSSLPYKFQVVSYCKPRLFVRQPKIQCFSSVLSRRLPFFRTVRFLVTGPSRSPQNVQRKLM